MINFIGKVVRGGDGHRIAEMGEAAKIARLSRVGMFRLVSVFSAQGTLQLPMNTPVEGLSESGISITIGSFCSC
jgi:hypothetical protein